MPKNRPGISTATGDDGTTGLADGTRLPKDHPRLAAYGTVDELNAVVGCVLALDTPKVVRSFLTAVQSELFILGSDLATPLGSRLTVPRITEDHVKQVELAGMALEQGLPPLQNFILPGGTPAAAHLHLARTVCRRAERCVQALARLEPVSPHALIYLNRLSDYLFLAAREVNRDAGKEETTWSITY